MFACPPAMGPMVLASAVRPQETGHSWSGMCRRPLRHMPLCQPTGWTRIVSTRRHVPPGSRIHSPTAHRPLRRTEPAIGREAESRAVPGDGNRAPQRARSARGATRVRLADRPSVHWNALTASGGTTTTGHWPWCRHGVAHATQLEPEVARPGARHDHEVGGRPPVHQDLAGRALKRRSAHSDVGILGGRSLELSVEKGGGSLLVYVLSALRPVPPRRACHGRACAKHVRHPGCSRATRPRGRRTARPPRRCRLPPDRAGSAHAYPPGLHDRPDDDHRAVRPARHGQADRSEKQPP